MCEPDFGSWPGARQGDGEEGRCLHRELRARRGRTARGASWSTSPSSVSAVCRGLSAVGRLRWLIGRDKSKKLERLLQTSDDLRDRKSTRLNSSHPSIS